MGRTLARTSSMDTRIPQGEVWVRRDVYDSVVASDDAEGAVNALLKRNPRDACGECAFFTPGRYGIGKCGFHNDVRTIDDTCPQFKVPMRVGMLLVNPRGKDSKFRHERVASPKEFDSRSFRTEVPPGAKDHRIIVGCPRGQWDNRKKKCRVGTRAQSILHPKGENNPCGYSSNPNPEKRDTAKCMHCGRIIEYDPVNFTWRHRGRGGEPHSHRARPMGNPAMPTEPMKVRTETGEEVTLRVPADWQRQTATWGMMEPIYRPLFGGVASKTHWKDAIGPVHFDEETPARLLADAIAFYHGGSEIEPAPQGGWFVSSKGYYEYIGG